MPPWAWLPLLRQDWTVAVPCEGSISRSATYFSLPRVRQRGGWGGRRGRGGGRGTGMRGIDSLSRLEDVISARRGGVSVTFIRPHKTSAVRHPVVTMETLHSEVSGWPKGFLHLCWMDQGGIWLFFVPDGNCLLPLITCCDWTINCRMVTLVEFISCISLSVFSSDP